MWLQKKREHDTEERKDMMSVGLRRKKRKGRRWRSTRIKRGEWEVDNIRQGGGRGGRGGERGGQTCGSRKRRRRRRSTKNDLT